MASLAITANQPTGDLVDGWLKALHFATVFGLPYRIIVCAIGIIITLLSVTGIYLWWKKRKARRISQERHAQLLEEEAGV